MKTLLVIAFVGLVASTVSARNVGGQGGQVNPGGPEKPADPAPGGLRDILGDLKDKVKDAVEELRTQGGPGGFMGGDRRDKFWNSCVCRNQCARNNGTKNIPCFSSRSEYLHCEDTTCTNQTCPDNQLFNCTTGVCEACPTGKHVDASKRMCVCDEGTTFDFRTRSCGPCPTDSIVTADRCHCSNTTVLHRATNACKVCPDGSTKVGRHCVCTDQKLFWSEKDFTCKACPGEWVNETIVSGGYFRRQRSVVVEVCECEGVNEVFNRVNVTCVPCPANSVAKTTMGMSHCVCSVDGQRYDFKTNTCVDRTSADDDDDDDDVGMGPAEQERRGGF